MERPGIRALVVLTLGVATLAACSEDKAPAQVTPSSAFPDDTGALPSPSGSTGTTGGTGATGGIPTGTLPTGPTGSLPGPGGSFGSGQAAVSVSGDVNASRTMPNVVTGIFAPPPGGMAVVWTAGGTDSTTFGLGGLSFTGTEPTAATLSLTLTIQVKGKIFSFVSTAGECSVTIGAASASQLAGAFTCSDLVSSGGEVVDATGSFAAQG